MKAFTKICFLVYLCLLGSEAYSQKVADPSPSGAGTSQGSAPNGGRELKIGDQVPDLTIDNVLNHPQGTLRLSDYRGKYLILDFWATWCSPCVAGFPKLDSLQNTFSDELAILPVTYQDRKEVEKLFGRMDRLQGIDMPMAVSDDRLRRLFPHRALPHYVWLDREGKVLAITEGKELNRDNISRIIRGGNALMETKKDTSVPYHREEFLISENRQIPAKPVLYQSALTGYIPGLISQYSYFPKDKRGKRVVMNNQPILSFFQKAYAEGKVAKSFHGNRIEIHSEKAHLLTSDLTGAEYEEWGKENFYCLEYIVPWERAEHFWEYFRADLKRWFPGFESGIEKRRKEVYALVRLENENSYRSAGGAPIFEMDPYSARLRNVPLSKFVARMNYLYLQNSPRPLIDRTGITHPVDLRLDAPLGNIEELKEALKAQGYGLVETTGEIDVLVIRDARP